MNFYVSSLKLENCPMVFTATECLHVDMSDSVLEISLNRPDKANAFNRSMWLELAELMHRADQSEDVRVVVLKGRGVNFCSGIDLELLGEMQTQAAQLDEGFKQEYIRDQVRMFQDCFTAVETCRKPVIAVVQGGCYGAGVDLITACDMRYGVTAAKFSVKEIDMAIVADLGTLQRLPRIVGEGRARELILTACVIDGEQAEAIGLLNKSYDSFVDLEEEVYEIVRELASKPPLAMRGVKQVLNASRDLTVTEGLEYVATWNAGMLLSSELQEKARAALKNLKTKQND
jgi:enoyl-CoA hydratase